MEMKQTILQYPLSALQQRFCLTQGMLPIVQQVQRVAPTSAAVLLLGESGVGKEPIAHMIHAGSRVREEIFLATNCGAISESLAESELFGHARGAFTGAIGNKKGLFQLANGGTLFLDEVGDMAPYLQVKVLRALELGEVMSVGSEKPEHVKIRIIAATNRDLGEEMKAKRFREDLFYRLNVFPIRIPPLRDRPHDIVELAEHFLAMFENERETPWRLTADALQELQSYDWPGNVRQFRNALECATILADGPRIDRAVIRQSIGNTSLKPQPSHAGQALLTTWCQHALENGWQLQRMKQEVEIEAITVAKRMSGTLGRAAVALGVDVATLHRKLGTRNKKGE